MSQPVPPAPGDATSVRDRSRALRRQSRETLARAARLVRRADELRGVPDRHALRMEVLRSAAREARARREQLRLQAAEAREAAEVEAWYRDRVREMLDAGWTRAELADVGVTDVLLRELGLPLPD